MQIFDESDPTVEQTYFCVAMIKAKNLEQAIERYKRQVGLSLYPHLHLELTEDLNNAMQKGEDTLKLDSVEMEGE